MRQKSHSLGRTVATKSWSAPYNRYMIPKELERRLSQATEFARNDKHEYVTVEHLLLALLQSPPTIEIIESLGGNVQKLKEDIRKHIKKNVPTIGKEALAEMGGFDNWIPDFTIACQRVLQNAAIQVTNAGRNQMGDGHVIVALFYEKNSYAVYLLEQQGITQFDVIEYISHGATAATATGASNPQTDIDGLPKDESKKSALEDFCVNLNEKAKKGKTDPLIGRGHEIQRIVQVLCRRNKNNPLIIGDPGVGKTALVEGLAQKIVQGEVPEKLKNAVVYSVDMGSILAGTKFRGDFESRLKNIVKEAKEKPGTILFIDEIHTVVGAGATSGGSMDASNLLKPALSQGDLTCIGSSTFKEYREHFEKDHALNRRFQKIELKPPTVDECLEILKGIKPQFEKFHHVKYSDEALKAAIDLTQKHMQSKTLPDKAIDVLDEAGAFFRNKTPDAKEILIDQEQIETVVAQITQLPIQQVSSSETKALKNLGDELKKVIFGQDVAIEKLTTAVKMSRSGLAKPDRPTGTFLFAGPTGVGKTELCKQLAKILNLELLRFDMSEYMEKHSVARLVGAPPGYVGYEEGGLLTEAINKHPYSLLLLDEIEKAHPDVYNILLQVMDAGRLTDSNGRTIDFKNVIIVLTTNAGAQDMAKGSIGITNNQSPSISVDAIKKQFNPEFINRLDGIVHFNSLSEDMILKVVEKFLNELKTQLHSKQVDFNYHPEVIKWLMQKGYSPIYGARPLARTIDEHIKKPLVEDLLFGRLQEGGSAQVLIRDNSPYFDLKSRNNTQNKS